MNQGHACPICAKEFATGPQLGGHVQSHRKSKKFEDWSKDETRKKILIAERGHKCEGCSLETWIGQKIVLTIDHIDGNSDNSVKENLRLLCWNCHALTPTFGAKNIGRHPESKRNRTIRKSIQRKKA